MSIREGVTFDDVLLVPQHSALESRRDVSTQVDFEGPNVLTILQHPIIPANMKSIATTEMIEAQVDSGGLAILHRFQTLEEQIAQYRRAMNRNNLPIVGASIGVREEDRYRAGGLIFEGVRIFCVDVAHGDSKLAVEMVKWLRRAGGITVIAGNVATARGAGRLLEAGAHAVKVGVGPGSLCTTRIETGCGVPQLTALMDVKAERDAIGHGLIIADGGIKNAGDCVKALCFADMLMLGRSLAGCPEAGGENHRRMRNSVASYNAYEGSSTHKANYVEGVTAWVEIGPSYSDVLTKLLEGIRSGCSYQGVDNIRALQESPEFIRITNAGLVESKPHDVE